MSGCLGWGLEGITKGHEKTWCGNGYKKNPIISQLGPKEGNKAEKDEEGHWPTREKCEQRLRGKMSTGGRGEGVRVETNGKEHSLADLEQDCGGP